MRIDHHAYQRGTRVAGFGLFLQAVIGLTLLIFGRLTGDTTFWFASQYVLLGTLVWVSLIVIFHQHTLERLEALEEDELAAARAGTSSIFDAAADEHRVAARRLALMYKWFLPSVSLALIVLLAGLGALMVYFLLGTGDAATVTPVEVGHTPYVGWAIAICLAFALISFIFSRFVAGMAKLDVWQNLRGGAGYMVGNALVMVAIGVGLGFRVFDNNTVIFYIAWAIPIFMGLVALEILLNFILALYRPRVVGETPRAAFDSKLLSLLAAPDSIVRSLNEAVNYQFGFDIASSWGYQLLLRSFAWLIAIGVGVFILLNTMVIVEPHQQAVRLQHGEIVGDVHESGILWKLPWPFQTARVYDVTQVRELALTPRRLRPRVDGIYMWTDELQVDRDRRHAESFIVGSSLAHLDVDADEDLSEEAVQIFEDQLRDGPPMNGPVDAAPDDEVERAVSRVVALLDAEITMQYRIDPGKGDAEGGLLNYLDFADDRSPNPRFGGMTTAERAIQRIALRQITQHLSTMALDDVLGRDRGKMATELRQRIQHALDAPGVEAGIEVLAVNFRALRPADRVAEKWEDLNNARQGRIQLVAAAQRDQLTTLTVLAGDPERAQKILHDLDRLDALEAELGRDAPQVVELQTEIELELREAGGEAAQIIAEAEADRWVELMNTQAQASRTKSQAMAYHAAPNLYMQRQLMRAISAETRGTRKYVIGIDPSRLELDVELKELSPIVDFGQALPDGE